METKQFKPYDRVLVRGNGDIWCIDLYSHWSNEKEQHVTLAYGDGIVMTDRDILPYGGNEHLVGTTEEPEEDIKLEEEYIMVADEPNISQYKWQLRRFVGIHESTEYFTACALDDAPFRWKYAISFKDFDPSNMEETRKHILCVKNGKIVRYKE